MESSLYLPVKRFLEKLGFEVKGEVCGCDLVALDGGAPHGGGHRRAEAHLHARSGAAGRRPHGRLRRDLAGGPRVAARARPRGRSAGQEAVPLPRARAARGVRRRARSRCWSSRCRGGRGAMPSAAPAIVEEHRRRRGDPAAGGSTRQPIMTAYRQQALACAAALARAPARPRDLKAGMPGCAEDPAQQRLWLVRQGRARRVCAVGRRQGGACALEGASSRHGRIRRSLALAILATERSIERTHARADLRRRRDRRLDRLFPRAAAASRSIVIERTGVACAASGKSGGFLALDWCDGTPARGAGAAQLRAAREPRRGASTATGATAA